MEIQTNEYSEKIQAKIDILVYLLYGLTYDEVMVVENALPQEERFYLDKDIYAKWLKEKNFALPNEQEMEHIINQTL